MTSRGERDSLPPPPAPPGKTVISGDELPDIDLPPGAPGGDPAGHTPAIGYATPPLPPPPVGSGPSGYAALGHPSVDPAHRVKPPRAAGGSGFTSLGRNALMIGLLGGLVGGILGALLAHGLETHLDELAFKIHDVDMARNVASALWVAGFAAVLGAVLMSWDGMSTGSGEKALIDGAKGALVGLVAGFVGGFVAQALYSKMLTDALRDDLDTSKLTLVRGLGWAVFGTLLGAGIGTPSGGRKIVNGLIGGALGGAVGGVLFQVMESEGTFGTNLFMLQLTGLTLTGVGVGVAIGLIETARKDAWITVGSGPMAGKEFILYLPRTRVGSDYRCEIVLAKDRSVAPVHLYLERDPQGRVTARPEAGSSLAVNGAPSGRTYLRSNDQLVVGASLLIFTERAAWSSP